MDSILTSIKLLLGITEECTDFDEQIIMDINSAFFIVTDQLGVGPSEGFSIESEQDEWSDFMEEGITLNLVKTYIYMDVKLIFDPPTSSSLLEALQKKHDQYEWRLTTKERSES